ncbi:uncharacterized protein METZ01_LOCUS111952 [marine metagenome]|uniref:Uncharacterized protein n=1 Tax=marine metagenome TaxID=408172 RepID=A0A381X3E2_9ZZZZ
MTGAKAVSAVIDYCQVVVILYVLCNFGSV